MNTRNTPIVINVGSVKIKAFVNESTTAKDLLNNLPYTANLDRYEFDYCGIMDKNLAFEEADKHNGWTNGDICLAGPYFTILFSGEEQSASHKGLVKLGEIPKEELDKVNELPSSITITISLA